MHIGDHLKMLFTRFIVSFRPGTMENQENRSPGERKGQTVRIVTCAASFLLRKHLGETEALSVLDKCKDL